MTREHKFLGVNRGNMRAKNFDDTVRLQSEIRREWIREIREDKPQEIAEGASSATRLASSSAASSPGRNEKTVPARSATEFQAKRKMEERIKWRGQNESQIGGEEKKNGRLVGAAETSKELAEWRRFQPKNLSILGLLKRKEWPLWQVRRSRPCQKEKEQSRQITRGRESRWARAAPRRERGD